MATGNSLVA